MLLITLLLISKLQGSVDVEDFIMAMHNVEDEIPWTSTFSVKHYCLVDEMPYSMRIAFEKEETVRHIECSRPWRLISWMCEEVKNTCDDFNIQVKY